MGDAKAAGDRADLTELMGGDGLPQLLGDLEGHRAIASGKHEFAGTCRKSNEQKWTARRTDLMFGSNSELRAIAEVCAASDEEQKFVDDFATAWTR
ncbi:hypothetical protein [Sphingomonas sp. ZT3P38]|uniref:hypothetical protein n=1 Tax=Parasphingomonas zepuensis TaxID=3096161 RepID=UPI003FA73CFD